MEFLYEPSLFGVFASVGFRLSTHADLAATVRTQLTRITVIACMFFRCVIIGCRHIKKALEAGYLDKRHNSLRNKKDILDK